MTDEDLEQISALLNEHYTPQIAKLIDEKLEASVGGFANTVQGILNQQPAAGEAPKEPVKAGPIEIMAVLSPIAMQLLQTIGQMRAVPQQDPKLWRETFSEGMVFTMNLVTLASRIGQPVDGKAFNDAVMSPFKTPETPTPPANGHSPLSADAFKSMATHGP